MVAFDDLNTIYGFPDGKTIATYTLSGSNAVVGGSEGSGIKVHESDPSNQDFVCASTSNHQEDVTCIATSPTKGFATGGSDGMVITYTEDFIFDKILVRSTVPIRSLSYHPDGSKLAIASDDEVIRIVLVADSSKIVQLSGHKHPLKSVDYNPTGDYLVSSDVKGDVIIWSVGKNEPAPKQIKKLSGSSYQSDVDAKLYTTVKWSPDDSCFAVPGVSGDIRVYTKGVWTPFYTLDGRHTAPVITLAWSPNGYYLASSSSDKSLVVWDTINKKGVHSEITSADVTGLAWSPKANQLIVTDSFGQIRFWDNVIPNDSNLPHPAMIKEKKMPEVKPEPTTKKDSIIEVEAEDDDIDMLFGDEEEELNDEGEEVEEDFIIDDDGAGYANAEQQETHARVKKQQQVINYTGISKLQNQLEMAFEPPSAFQPGETPYHPPEPNISFEPRQGERRYMAFNLIGVVTTIYQDDYSIINVEFHDQTEYRNYHFRDNSNFSMAAISSSGAVFAVESKEAPNRTNSNHNGSDSDDEEDEGNQGMKSCVHFRPHHSGTEKDWTIYMLEGEDVVSVAINTVSVIVTTTLGYVRIFTASGIQRYIFSVENIVSITANSDLAFLVYSKGPAFKDQQNLEYILLNSETNEVIQKDYVQLSTDSELNWIGFSETKQVVTFDSKSVLRVLSQQRRHNQAQWVPVLHGKTENSKYWPVGVLRDKLMCIVVRGKNLYPFFPRPMVKNIELEMPLLALDTEVGKLEEEIYSKNVRILHERDEFEAAQEDDEDIRAELDTEETSMDAAILKLVNLACKSEKESRALDLCLALSSSDAMSRAIKIATFYNFNVLAEKMSLAQSRKFSDNDIVTPSTLADSIAKLPTIFTSTQPAFESDLSLLRSADKNKRTMMEDEAIVDPTAVKKPKPFKFSNH